MSTRLPIEINPYRLVEQRRILTGQLSLKRLSRIQELASAETGEVFVELEFTETDTGLPTVKGKVKGSVPLQCQRCLESFDYSVDSDVEVILLKSDAEAERLQESHDTWLVEDNTIFLQDFIEDELLLSLPVIARHKNCDLDEAARAVSFDIEVEKEKQKDENENPFAALKGAFKSDES